MITSIKNTYAKNIYIGNTYIISIQIKYTSYKGIYTIYNYTKIFLIRDIKSKTLAKIKDNIDKSRDK